MYDWPDAKYWIKQMHLIWRSWWRKSGVCNLKCDTNSGVRCEPVLVSPNNTHIPLVTSKWQFTSPRKLWEINDTKFLFTHTSYMCSCADNDYVLSASVFKYLRHSPLRTNTEKNLLKDCARCFQMGSLV